MNFKYKLGFIGYGNMASAIAQGILTNKVVSANEIMIFDHNDDKMARAKALGMCVAASNTELAENCEYVFLAVKPQAFDALKDEIQNAICGNVIISILAGTTKSKIYSAFDNIVVARAMPNTPSMIGYGMTGLDTHDLNDGQANFVHSLFMAVGKVIAIEEHEINDIIAISGSGPAYVYQFMKGMYDKAVSLGFEEKTAKKLVAQTVIGAAQMFFESEDTIDVLTEKVCSKGGTTIEAVKYFQDHELNKTIDEGIQACLNRAIELSEGK